MPCQLGTPHSFVSGAKCTRVFRQNFIALKEADSFSATIARKTKTLMYAFITRIPGRRIIVYILNPYILYAQELVQNFWFICKYPEQTWS